MVYSLGDTGSAHISSCGPYHIQAPPQKRTATAKAIKGGSYDASGLARFSQETILRLSVSLRSRETSYVAYGSPEMHQCRPSPLPSGPCKMLSPKGALGADGWSVLSQSPSCTIWNSS